jgi:hypothetical protein
MSSPRALLVGAFERDNFGDLLFLLQTERFLDGVDVVAGAPIASDMTPLLDRFVPAYGPLLESEQFDVVWTVGGEVGATTLEGALRMSLDAEVFDQLARLPTEARRAAERELCGSDRVDSPYMPRPSAFPLNNGAALVLNSVGISGIGALPARRQEELITVLREADRIAVRDRASSELLSAHGVMHELVPDLVHSVAITRPGEPVEDGAPVLVQAPASYLGRVGVETFAEALAAAPFDDFSHVKLFLAGTAYGHDSLTAYEQVVRAYEAASGGRPIEICRTRKPWELVDEIARAGLWIGMSLHGRIISTAYGVPRVSLALPKVDGYARTWDGEMPFGVELDRLADAVAAARSPGLQAQVAERGEELGRLALDNATRIAGEVFDLPPLPRLTRRLASLEGLRRVELDDTEQRVHELQVAVESVNARVAELADALERERVEALRARADAGELRAALIVAQEELNGIRRGQVFRIATRLGQIRAALRSLLPARAR